MTLEHHAETIQPEQKLHEELIKRISEFISDPTDKADVLSTIEELLKDENVKAVLVSGSYATKTNKLDSDLDLVVLTEQTSPVRPDITYLERRRIGQLKNLNKGGKYPWIDLLYFNAQQARRGKFNIEQAVLIKEAKILFANDSALVEDAQRHAKEQSSLKELLKRDLGILSRRVFGGKKSA
jgi:predicted nucleotidyltransferase